MRYSLALLFWLLATPAFAGDLDYAAFSHIPVQHEGRLKPLETFALVHLQRFHGSDHLGRRTAIGWLAEVIFDPATAMAQPLFLLKDADAEAMLGLPPKPDHLYSFAEATEAVSRNRKLIESLLQLPSSNLTSGQRAALELYDNSELFAQMTLSCTLFLRLNIAPPSRPPGETFLDYFPEMPLWEAALKDVVRRKGKDIDKFTPQELQLAQAMEKLSMIHDSSEGNELLRVIPPAWGGDTWLAPWAVFHSGQGAPQTAKLMSLWKALAAAYQDHDAARWQQASRDLLQATGVVPGVRPAALHLEVLYHRFEPLEKSIGLYTVGLILALLCLMGRQWRRRVWLAAITVTVTAAILHVGSIAVRIYILSRPPVGTLYESLLFVSLIAALFGLFLEFRLRSGLGLLTANFIGGSLLLTSRGFAGNDTMGVLVAVLNTNFWLATHVLCITSGYAFGIVAALIAHVHLLMRCAGRHPDAARQVLRRSYGTALIALLFTSLGTILGGIWADQSWGRFWGWDPKENGALLICLWLIWILHGRLSGRLRERGFAVGLALLNVVIALSWLGVNLLSTGLHSYGFTDKAAWSFAVFCIAEFLFAAITYATLWRRDHAEAH